MNDTEPLAEHHRVWEDREGLMTMGVLAQHQARLAWRRSLPTFGHAVRCFEQLIRAGGDALYDDPDTPGGRLSLHRRDDDDPDWIIPSPLVRLTPLGPRGDGRFTAGVFRNLGAVLPSDAPPGWTHDDPPYWEKDPSPDIAPAGEHARAGRIRFAEGPRFRALSFGADGLPSESCATGGDSDWYARHFTARPYAVDPLAIPPGSVPVSLLVAESLRPDGITLEEIVELVFRLNDRELDPTRVRLPMPVPGGPTGVRTRAGQGLSRALAREEVPAEGGVVIVDGFRGEVVAVAGNAADAWSTWLERVAEQRPKPPGWGERPERKPAMPAPAPTGPQTHKDAEGNTIGFSTGTLRLTAGPSSDTPWPIPLPQNVPAMRVVAPPLATAIPEPLAASGFDRWRRFFHPERGWSAALVRDDDGGGVTLVGQGIADLIGDWATIEAGIAEGRAREQEWMEGLEDSGPPNLWKQHKQPAVIEYWSIWDTARRLFHDIPSMSGASAKAAWDFATLDATRVHWAVTVASGPRRGP